MSSAGLLPRPGLARQGPHIPRAWLEEAAIQLTNIGARMAACLGRCLSQRITSRTHPPLPTPRAVRHSWFVSAQSQSERQVHQ
jgi:hypothetical protein